jgi:methyl-accepting chemotaxis protein
MIAILIIVSVIGYRGLNSASTLFLDFGRVATMSEEASDSVTNINASAYYLEKFMRLSVPRDMDTSVSSQEKTLAAVQKALGHAIAPERKRDLERTANLLREYVEALGQIKNAFIPWYTDYQQIIRPNFETLENIAGALGDILLKEGNAAALNQINDIWRALSRLSTSIDNFRQSGVEKNAAVIDKLLEQNKSLHERFRSSLSAEASKNAFAEYQEKYDAIVRAYQKSKTAVIKAEDVLERAYGWDAELEDTLKRINAETAAEMGKRHEEIIDSNRGTQRFMLVSSLVGLFVGMLFASFILISLVSILNKIAAFASAVANGDFEHDAGIKEKGEIGRMTASIQQIPGTLKAILADYLLLEKKIESGIINQKADSGKYHGGFSVLVNGTNNILSRLNMVIDSIPSPVVILNKDARIEYMNGASIAVAGSDFQGKFCKQVFNRDDDGTETDALTKAMTTRHPASGETRAHPGGNDLDVSYTAIPFLNKEGSLTSILQLITDLSFIKKQQRVILKAASQASEISNRMAAASEELSAQVEQVSRGAEVQRARVESTASAMTEMNSTVLEVARSAGQASEQSELTRSKAGAGSDLVDQVVEAINEVDKVAATLQTNMRELGTQAESIGGVMTVISDIADQTNLLALNAAIEAARAGEAGRGFAVVADEVRKLAEKTMSATQEVSASINAIQHSTHVNVKEVENAVRSITRATSLADSSGEALKEIVSLASTNSTVVTSIATAAEEQSATSEEINRAIEEINQVVGDTTNGMIQSSAAVQELARMAQELRRIMETLK